MRRDFFVCIIPDLQFRYHQLRRSNYGRQTAKNNRELRRYDKTQDEPALPAVLNLPIRYTDDTFCRCFCTGRRAISRYIGQAPSRRQPGEHPVRHQTFDRTQVHGC